MELGFENLRYQAARGRSDVSLRVDSNRISAFGAMQPGDAVASAVRGFADVASSTANAQSTFAADILTGGQQ